MSEDGDRRIGVNSDAFLAYLERTNAELENDRQGPFASGVPGPVEQEDLRADRPIDPTSMTTTSSPLEPPIKPPALRPRTPRSMPGYLGRDGSPLPAGSSFDSPLARTSPRPLAMQVDERDTHGSASVEGILLAGRGLPTPAPASTRTGAYASRPAAGTTGGVYLPTDAAELDVDNGTTWDKWGPIYSMTRAPTYSGGNWTWVNQGTATVTDSASGLFVADATGHAGNSFAILKRALPTNKTVIAHLSIVHGVTTGTPTAGVVWRQSAGGTPGRIVGIGYYADGTNGFAVSEKMSSPTVWGGANYFQNGAFNPMNFWVKLRITVNNRETYFSPDGQNWLLVHSVASTDWLTPDEVGVFVDAVSGPICLLLDSWTES